MKAVYAIIKNGKKSKKSTLLRLRFIFCDCLGSWNVVICLHVLMKLLGKLTVDLIDYYDTRHDSNVLTHTLKVPYSQQNH